jgi:hypothetical protein
MNRQWAETFLRDTLVWDANMQSYLGGNFKRVAKQIWGG